jgi:hypothetical protein
MLSDQLAACAHELELVSDEFAAHGMETRTINSAAAILGDVADRVRKCETPAADNEDQHGDASDADASMSDESHPRMLLALSGMDWDFKLPGCAVFGCISGKTDAETYRDSHDRLVDRLRGLHADFDTRHHLLEHVADRWEAYDEAQKIPWQAADCLISSLGTWADPVNDEQRYKTFAEIPRIVAELVINLDDAKYEEYCTDCDGISRRKARAVAAKAHELADAVSNWADAL